MTTTNKWVRAALPETVWKLAYRHGAIIVGSQALLYAEGKPPDLAKDWDLFVPFAAWRGAVMEIPRTAVPNGNRGWRFSVNDVTFDVWPDELARFCDEATSPHRTRAKPGAAWAVDLAHGLVFRAERTERIKP